MTKVFVAFSSKDATLAKAIERACEEASHATSIQFVPWTSEDGSGTPLHVTVENWLSDYDGLIADVSYINDNVTYEIGLAIGAGKPLRIIRNNGVHDKELRDIGLLDGLIRDEYRTTANLVAVLLNKGAPTNKWAKTPRDSKQPVYVISPPTPNSETTRLFSALKKQARFKFRSFKPWEIARLTALELWEQISSSFGVVCTWQAGATLEARRNNQRAALAFGMGRGGETPALLLAHDRTTVPGDLSERAMRWWDLNALDGALRTFRNEIQDEINDYDEQQPLPITFLDSIYTGDAAAENEQDRLKTFFLDTEEFKRTFSGDANIIIGRKGSGKSAIFLQVRDRIRVNKQNIVLDLNPEGYQLIKLKEIMVQLTSLGARKEFVAAFWQYVLWLEIAYKLLEKDERLSKVDSAVAQRYSELSAAFRQRVDTGGNDFSERLRLLTELIATRFEEKSTSSTFALSSEVLQVVYGTDIAEIRDKVLSYLKTKGIIVFLFDNLDRMRSPAGFDTDDAVVIIGLVEAMQDIAKKFRRDRFDFRWVVFIRSDVYEFLIRDMADYGKLAQQTLEWNDPELLKRILKERILATVPQENRDWGRLWPTISTTTVDGRDTLDFLVDNCLMRPRYLIRLFDAAKRRAINMGAQKIGASDYLAALKELGWNVMDDLDRELSDIVKDSKSLLFEISQLDGACGIKELEDAVENRVGAISDKDRAIDVILWSGAIGILADKETKFIYDCGYKLQFMRSIMTAHPHSEICLHPVLRNLFTSKTEGSVEAEA